MERCPVCRARLRDEVVCPRCGTDLRLSLATERQAQTLEQSAVDWFARGDLRRAEQVLEDALRLRSTPLARLLLGFIRERSVWVLPKPRDR